MKRGKKENNVHSKDFVEKGHHLWRHRFDSLKIRISDQFNAIYILCFVMYCEHIKYTSWGYSQKHGLMYIIVSPKLI